MPAPKTSGDYIHYHQDGSMWAKGKMRAGKPDGYWGWFRKSGIVAIRTSSNTPAAFTSSGEKPAAPAQL